MAGDVESQRSLDANHLGYYFQVVIDVITDATVGASFVGAGILDDGELIIGSIFGILVKNH